jgi:hypothetical protein
MNFDKGEHMKTQSIDTERIKQDVDLRTIAATYTTLHRESSTEMSGPCPKCGGTDRFRCKKELFMCRQCHPKWADAIEFGMWFRGVGFRESAEWLTGGVLPTTSTPVQPVVKPASVTEHEFDEVFWLKRVIEDNNSLMSGSGKFAQQARDYLTGRGLTVETIQAFKLGFRGVNLPRSEQKEIAISLPWFNPDSKLVAVKYRFTATYKYINKDNDEAEANKTSRGNFTGELFGWQAVKGPSRNRALIICEGEINALSLWQAGNGLIDVLSTGTEGMMKTLPDAVVEFASQYAYKIIWADKKEISNDTARKIKADFSMPSPVSPAFPKGQDANEFLKVGKLEKLLAGMFKRIGATIETPPPPPVLPTEEVEQVEVNTGREPPEPIILYAGLTWAEAERIRIELNVPYRYGTGADPSKPGAYRVVERDYKG